MPRKTYPLEYRQRLVELVRAGQRPENLAREYEPSAKTIREWVERADAIDRGKGGLTEAEKDRRIRELERQLEMEREEKEILKNSRGLVRTGERRGLGLTDLPRQEGVPPRP